ncbi:MAG: lipopolysaccharide biosynthesis protein [Lachnospiraceae bacterium]|nr:lipopolysaccharide biosynthesis protein [Lachnospiraceae bacterium]
MKNFLLNSKDIQKNSFIWNMIGSMLMAFQSVIMLTILTRFLSLYDAGVFTIAYASANLFLNIGKYGMRNYQVSDVNRQSSFSDYLVSRIFTTFVMIIVSIVYVEIVSNTNDYSSTKSFTIFWMCLFKVVDSIEDVYLGMYQQENRLDVAGKILTIRMVITIALFGICLVVTGNLLNSLIISTIATSACLLYLIVITISNFPSAKWNLNFKSVLSLLSKSFPLFLGAFLAFYIGNAPKYAIDSQLSDELQACYGFIAMPVFVIGLLNSFIFNPMIAKMSLQWKEQDRASFFKSFKLQLVLITAITFICEVGAFLLGIPVLSLLYNTDLSAYKNELLVLLLGGGFLALSGLLVTVITIIRFQKSLALGYIFVSVMAYFLCPVFVKKYQLMGASALYTILMVILCLIFAFIFWIGCSSKHPKPSKQHT